MILLHQMLLAMDPRSQKYLPTLDWMCTGERPLWQTMAMAVTTGPQPIVATAMRKQARRRSPGYGHGLLKVSCTSSPGRIPLGHLGRL